MMAENQQRQNQIQDTDTHEIMIDFQTYKLMFK